MALNSSLEKDFGDPMTPRANLTDEILTLRKRDKDTARSRVCQNKTQKRKPPPSVLSHSRLKPSGRAASPKNWHRFFGGALRIIIK